MYLQIVDGFLCAAQDIEKDSYICGFDNFLPSDPFSDITGGMRLSQMLKYNPTRNPRYSVRLNLDNGPAIDSFVVASAEIQTAIDENVSTGLTLDATEHKLNGRLVGHFALPSQLNNAELVVTHPVPTNKWRSKPTLRAKRKIIKGEKITYCRSPLPGSFSSGDFIVKQEADGVRGVYANRRFNQGEYVTDFGGQFLTKTEFDNTFFADMSEGKAMIIKSYLHSLNGRDHFIYGEDVRQDFQPENGFNPIFHDNNFVGLAHLINTAIKPAKKNIDRFTIKSLPMDVSYFKTLRVIEEGEQFLWEYHKGGLDFWSPIMPVYSDDALTVNLKQFMSDGYTDETGYMKIGSIVRLPYSKQGSNKVSRRAILRHDSVDVLSYIPSTKSGVEGLHTYPVEKTLSFADLPYVTVHDSRLEMLPESIPETDCQWLYVRHWLQFTDDATFTNAIMFNINNCDYNLRSDAPLCLQEIFVNHSKQMKSRQPAADGFLKSEIKAIYRIPPVIVAKSSIDHAEAGLGLYTYIPRSRTELLWFFTGNVFENVDTLHQAYTGIANAHGLDINSTLEYANANGMFFFHDELRLWVDPISATQTGCRIHPNHLVGYINEPPENTHANAEWDERIKPLIHDKTYYITTETYNNYFTPQATSSTQTCRSEDHSVFSTNVDYKKRKAQIPDFLQVSVNNAINVKVIFVEPTKQWPFHHLFKRRLPIANHDYYYYLTQNNPESFELPEDARTEQDIHNYIRSISGQHLPTIYEMLVERVAFPSVYISQNLLPMQEIFIRYNFEAQTHQDAYTPGYLPRQPLFYLLFENRNLMHGFKCNVDIAAKKMTFNIEKHDDDDDDDDDARGRGRGRGRSRGRGRGRGRGSGRGRGKGRGEVEYDFLATQAIHYTTISTSIPDVILNESMPIHPASIINKRVRVVDKWGDVNFPFIIFELPQGIVITDNRNIEGPYGHQKYKDKNADLTDIDTQYPTQIVINQF